MCVFLQTLAVSVSGHFPNQGFECNEQQGQILRILITDLKKVPQEKESWQLSLLLLFHYSIIMSFPLLIEYSIAFFLFKRYLSTYSKKKGRKEGRKAGKVEESIFLAFRIPCLVGK